MIGPDSLVGRADPYFPHRRPRVSQPPRRLVHRRRTGGMQLGAGDTLRAAHPPPIAALLLPRQERSDGPLLLKLAGVRQLRQGPLNLRERGIGHTDHQVRRLRHEPLKRRLPVRAGQNPLNLRGVDPRERVRVTGQELLHRPGPLHPLRPVQHDRPAGPAGRVLRKVRDVLRPHSRAHSCADLPQPRVPDRRGSQRTSIHPDREEPVVPRLIQPPAHRTNNLLLQLLPTGLHQTSSCPSCTGGKPPAGRSNPSVSAR